MHERNTITVRIFVFLYSCKASVKQGVNLSFVFVKTEVRTLNFRKGELQTFKEFVSRTPWETALRDKAAEQIWQIFKIAFYTVQEVQKIRPRR